LGQNFRREGGSSGPTYAESLGAGSQGVRSFRPRVQNPNDSQRVNTYDQGYHAGYQRALTERQ
jgi:hypothetical protein